MRRLPSVSRVPEAAAAAAAAVAAAAVAAAVPQVAGMTMHRPREEAVEAAAVEAAGRLLHPRRWAGGRDLRWLLYPGRLVTRRGRRWDGLAHRRASG